jgi:8-hydroxy-5-deazaflavin:NADPH oxidoreductase
MTTATNGGNVMQYAIIGAGAIGSALARQFAMADVAVGLAASRGPQAVAALADGIGPQVTPVEVTDALAADRVLLAVPFDAVRGLVEQVSDWGGRIVVDATNAIDYATFGPADLGGRASSDLVEEWAAGLRVVKAFGHTWAKVLARDPRVPGGRRVAFVSGNHPDANAEVVSLATRFGFDPVDLGRNDAGGLLQSFGGPLTGRSLVSQDLAGSTPPEMDVAADR